MKQKSPIILLTNDDGFFAEGIQAIFKSLQDQGKIFLVAPDREISATSLALTLHHPLRVQTIDNNIFAVDGTPADCIYLALQLLLPEKPDLILSGINHGPNLGQQDIAYSGTVAGALQGSFLGIPSVSLSLSPDKSGYYDFAFAAGIARGIVIKMLSSSLPQGVTLNINIPPPPFREFKLVKLGQKRYHPEILTKKDPRGRTYYWIGTGTPRAEGDDESDVKVIEKGFTTVTPLHKDMTHPSILEDSCLKEIFNELSETLKNRNK
ncbi:MAG: 5'/3'-nucleotidase SurE [Acidobacteriota bacterium]